jgi:hypothetical protein
MGLVILSSIAISQNSMLVEKLHPKSKLEKLKSFPSWPAIIMGFITPCFFLASALFNKHLTSKKIGFDATTLSYGSSGVASTVVIILGATWYWRKYPFNLKLFLVGLISSAIDTAGKVCI